MKVIGTYDEGYVFEVSKNEAANLLGWHSKYASEFKGLKRGDIIEVSKMYSRLTSFGSNKDRLITLAQSLRSHADMLESFDPLVRECIESNENEETGQ